MVAYKSNWDESREHLRKWWKQNGFVIGKWGGIGGSVLHEETSDPGWPQDPEKRYRNVTWRGESIHYSMARTAFPLDTLPIANCNIGPGSLALFLGSQPAFGKTVWFEPIYKQVDLGAIPTFKFDASNEWWKITEQTLIEAKKWAATKYIVGCPDLIENIDILASLRGIENMLMDMCYNPEWVEQKVAEINEVWFEAYRRIYEIIKLEDGSSAYQAFNIWGDKKTAKVQCDASAMISPDMFERFVMPVLTEQCNRLDHSIFHLDGKECICHLEQILTIDSLDAVEWSPDPSSPGGGDPYWFDMYKKILDSGKSLQLINIHLNDVTKILDGIGTNGVYILAQIKNEKEAEELSRMVGPYRNLENGMNRKLQKEPL